jgi:hypothetical protein
MSNCTRYLGLDVHAETITAAIAEGRGKIRSLGKSSIFADAIALCSGRLVVVSAKALTAFLALAGHAPSTGLDLPGHVLEANLTCQIMLEQVPPPARPRVPPVGGLARAGALPARP